MSIKYWWSDDLQWFCVLVDDGSSKATVSLTPEQAADLRSELARLRNEQPKGGDVRTAPESCPHCFNEDDCGQIEVCKAVESVYAPQDVRELRKQLRDLSDAYLRLRGIIPGAFDTPHAPSPEIIWRVTENALRAALAQSDAQPVLWQFRWKRSAQTWSEWCIEWNKDVAASYSRHPEYEVRPLYTAPHRPDASGLIEAADGFAELRQANVARNVEWTKGNTVALSPSFRGNELAGEVGEACNVLKKIEREQLGLVGSRATVEQLAEELADIIICADLTAMDFGIGLFPAVRDKFNATSEARGLQTKIHVRAADRSGD